MHIINNHGFCHGLLVSVIIMSCALSCREPDTRHYSEFEESLIERGLVDIRKLDPAIRVDLMYAGDDNFMGFNAYGDLKRAFLYKKAADKLVKARQYLGRIRSGYTIIVYDAVRPRSLQYIMWDTVKGTPKQRYVAHPESGSMHNYGAAVDVSILDENGDPLDMGTEVDHLGPLAEPRHEDKYLAEGKLTFRQVRNRKLLRKVMNYGGFTGVLNEWWHYNAFPRGLTRKIFKIIE